MGTYIYSVRTSSVTVAGIGSVYALAYLLKPSWVWGETCGKTARLVGKAESTWANRQERPKYVFLTPDTKPADGLPVWEWDGRSSDYDTTFSGKVRTVGVLRSTKVGRKTVWTVEPEAQRTTAACQG